MTRVAQLFPVTENCGPTVLIHVAEIRPLINNHPVSVPENPLFIPVRIENGASIKYKKSHEHTENGNAFLVCWNIIP